MDGKTSSVTKLLNLFALGKFEEIINLPHLHLYRKFGTFNINIMSNIFQLLPRWGNGIFKKI